MAFESRSITGSLFGTSSWAVSSSWAIYGIYSTSSYTIPTTITVGATTTAPTKGTVITDQVYYRNVGGTNYSVNYNYRQTNAGGAGSGDYLFTLPGGLQFDTTVHPLYTGVLDIALWSSAINTMSNMGTNTATLPASWVIPYSSTRFRIAYFENISTIRMFNSNSATSMTFGQAGCHFRWNFEFTAA